MSAGFVPTFIRASLGRRICGRPWSGKAAPAESSYCQRPRTGCSLTQRLHRL